MLKLAKILKIKRVKFIHIAFGRPIKYLGRLSFWIILALNPLTFLVFHDYLLLSFSLSLILYKILKLPVSVANFILDYTRVFRDDCVYLKKYFLYRFARLIASLYSIKRKVTDRRRRRGEIKIQKRKERQKQILRQKLYAKLIKKTAQLKEKSGIEEKIEVLEKDETDSIPLFNKIEKEAQEKEIIKIDKSDKRSEVMKSGWLAPKTFPAEDKKRRLKEFILTVRQSFFGLRLSKKILAVFFLLIIFGVFSFSIPRLTEPQPIEKETEDQIPKPEIPEEREILGEKVVKEEKAHRPLAFKDIIGQVFAGIALFFGAIFFLYSLKYYLTSIIVLIASQAVNGQQGRGNRLAGFFYRLFFRGNGPDGNSFANGNGNSSVGFLPNIKHNGQLKKYPLISVHLPFYNEKKVVNRILTACTSFDYPDYEVVVADDSTDETREIIRKWLNHPRIKILHRENRAGFKGGALREALAQTDPRAEFIVVFDADFIPYPDTIRQFLKYFYINGNGNKAPQKNNNNRFHNSYKETNTAAVQGYQWHVLNKNENWVTRSVRSEFAGSYVIDRPGTELVGGLKQIAGSVYMIRADVLRAYDWTDSITEDFELTLRIYRDGWKVIYTPYIQAPAECVSTIKRLIRQRMRWAEGHTANVRKYFWSLIKSPNMSRREKLEFFYLAPYYLQSAFLLIGTFCWFLSDVILHAQLPFWTAFWGWSLVFVNLFALPLINTIGLFFEESQEKDYLGVFSFIALTYIVAPFQALAALRGLFKKKSGWFRTPKSGHITDLYFRSRYRRWFRMLFPGRKKTGQKARQETRYLKLATAHSKFQDFRVKKRKGSRKIANIVSLFLIIASLSLQFLSASLPSYDLSRQDQTATEFNLIKGPAWEETGQNKNIDFSFNTDQARVPNTSIITLNSPTGKTTDKNTVIGAPDEIKNLFPRKIPSEDQSLPEDSSSMPSPERPRPGEPIELKDDLPEKEKEAVRIAWFNWPEGKEEIELEDFRTETSKKFLTKEGKIRQEVGDGPIHYFDQEKGLWQNISYDIKPIEGFNLTGEEAAKYANETNYFKTYYKNSSDKDNYLTFTLNDNKISYRLPDHPELGHIQNHEAVVNGNQITYPEIYPGIDLRYTVGLDSLLEEYIVKSPKALENLAYVSQEFQTKGVSVEKGQPGIIYFTDNKTGKKLWHFPEPVLYELNNQKERNYDLTREIIEQGDRYLSKKILGEEALNWLKNPRRKYPIVIDDSHVVDYTDTNYYDGYVTYNGSTYATTDNSTTLLIGGSTTPDPDESYRAFMKFDISDLTEASYDQVDLFVTNITAQAGDTVDIKSLDNDPNGRAAADIWSDITNGTVYVNDTTYFQSATYRLWNLGSDALTDLNNALGVDWFGVSFQSSDETNDYAAPAAEEHGTTVYRPRLAGLYDAIDTDSGYYLGGVSRNTFFDPKYVNYWVLAANNTERIGQAWYSDDDGATWTEDTAERFSSGLGAINNTPNIWFKEGTGGGDGTVYVVWYYSGDLYFNSGTVGDGAIDWGTPQNIGDWNYYNAPNANVTVATNGICWATGRDLNTTNKIKTVKSDDSNCNSWSETTHADNLTSPQIDPDIVPLNNGEIYAAWNQDGDMKGRRWNGSSWDAIDSICSACVANNTAVQVTSMVVDENYDIHLVYIDSGLDLQYRRYDETNELWGNAYEVHTGTDYYPNIALDSSTGEIYAAYNNYPNHYARTINYYKCDYVTDDCLDAGDWGSEQNAYTSFYLSSGFGFSYKADGRIWAISQEGLYAINIVNIIIPEAVWFLIPVIAFLPKQIQNLIKGRKKNRKKRRLLASSVFGFKKKK